MSVAELLVKYQTGIVGVIGFAGVIVTLVVNARLTRRRVLESRDHERETLSRALLAELRSLRRSNTMSVQRLKEVNPGESNVAIPAAQMTSVFDRNVARVGLLKPEGVGPVLDAYLHVKEFDRNIALMTRPDQSGHYRVLDGQHASVVATMMESQQPRLDAAVAALES